MESKSGGLSTSLGRDLTAGLVVFLVALPLCMGLALVSGAPLLSGVLAGIVGGLLVGSLSGSHTSISGPAAGLATMVAAQIALLGSFRAFQLAVVVAGLIQVALGLARAGFVSAFFPSSVIRGLTVAIGLILVLKQLPHVLGHDPDPEGDMAFLQVDHENTFSELAHLFADIHPGAAAVGLASVAIMIIWGRLPWTRRSRVPAPLIAVLAGCGLSVLFRQLGGRWVIEASHLVQVPVAEGLGGLLSFLQRPDFTQWANPAVYTCALVIAALASLETLLNLEVIDQLDPARRDSPPSRELLAQGLGNIACGMIGGLPITSVAGRSTVNVNAGARTKLSAIVHGGLLLVSVVLLPSWLNLIPLSCVAAILLVTGAKLANPALVRTSWSQGRHQFIPFAVTVAAIILTDLLVGAMIGLGASLSFILASNVRRPVRRVVEKQLGGEVVHVELATQVSFLNRAALTRVLDEVPRGGHVLLDARNTDYIDPDVLDLIHDFSERTAPARGVEVSLLGFRRRYHLMDQTRYVDHATRELQCALSPEQVLQVLRDGHERVRTGRRLTRDFGRQVSATADGQYPLAVVLSCIDSRTPAELIFDLGMGDIFSVRVAGNITSRKILGSIEYGCAVAGAKLVLVMGHTRCGAVSAAVNLANSPEPVAVATNCDHVEFLIRDIQQSLDPSAVETLADLSGPEKTAFIDTVARRNVSRVVAAIRDQSTTLDRLAREGRIAIVGAMYDVVSGNIEFLPTESLDPVPTPQVVT